MATWITETYSTFSNRLTDWLNTAGGEVPDLPLDLLNRAQQYLCLYRAWDGLVTHYSVTMSGDSCTMPANFTGTVISVYHDSNDDGVPDMFYYRNGPVSCGYKAVDTFDKATGHSWQLTFFTTPSHTPVVVYPVPLDDFDGDGDEYSFFPSNLLLATAKMLHIQDSGLVGNEYQAVLNEQQQLLRDYEQSHQYQNVEWRMRQIDQSGEEIDNDAYDLEGGTDSSVGDDYDNDYDLG